MRKVSFDMAQYSKVNELLTMIRICIQRLVYVLGCDIPGCKAVAHRLRGTGKD
jgi:hypothetical protein